MAKKLTREERMAMRMKNTAKPIEGDNAVVSSEPLEQTTASEEKSEDTAVNQASKISSEDTKTQAEASSEASSSTKEKADNIDKEDKIDKIDKNDTEEKKVAKEAPAPKKAKKAVAEKYNNKEVFIPLLLSEELSNYLTFKAQDLGMSAKAFFKQLMIKEIESGSLEEAELVAHYRKVQHATIKKSIPVDEVLRDDMKEKARKYHMKNASYIAYVIHKNYKNDDEYDVY